MFDPSLQGTTLTTLSEVPLTEKQNSITGPLVTRENTSHSGLDRKLNSIAGLYMSHLNTVVHDACTWTPQLSYHALHCDTFKMFVQVAVTLLVVLLTVGQTHLFSKILLSADYEWLHWLVLIASLIFRLLVGYSPINAHICGRMLPNAPDWFWQIKQEKCYHELSNGSQHEDNISLNNITITLCGWNLCTPFLGTMKFLWAGNNI